MHVWISGELGNLARECAAMFIRHAHYTNIDLSKRQEETNILLKPTLESKISSSKPDLIIHAAALVSTEACDPNPRIAIETNVNGTLNIVEIAKKLKVPLLYFSSTTIYDMAAAKSSSRDPLRIYEDSPINPMTVYGLTKYWGEQLTRRLYPDSYVVRPCFVFGGECDHISAIVKIVKASQHLPPFGNGSIPNMTLDPEFLKDWLYAEDFAEAIVLLSERIIRGLSTTPHVFNVSRHNPVTMNMVYEMIIQYHKALYVPQIEWQPNDDYLANHIVRSDRIRDFTNWVPKYTLPGGIQQVFEFLTRKMNKEKSNA